MRRRRRGSGRSRGRRIWAGGNGFVFVFGNTCICRGNRSRKDVTYQEQLSEKDWLKAIGADEEGSSDDAQ